MCLIIQRKPNFEIPFEKFKAAIEVNPDGYGIAYPESGKLYTLRSSVKADPDELYKLVNEELIEKDLMIHLRYTTAGATNLRNSHPFPILEKHTDGIDLRMAHNGTLPKWKTRADKGKDESDTRAFVKGFVRPLFKRLCKGMSPEELLGDDFTKELLEDQLTTASVLTFLDSEGNSLICNPTGNGGKEEDGWYYSNTYSFKEDYRKPGKPPAQVHRLPNYGTTGTVNGQSQGAGSTYTRKNVSRASSTLAFSKMYQFDPNNFHLMSDQAIDMVVENPDASRLLIKELLFELSKAKGI